MKLRGENNLSSKKIRELEYQLSLRENDLNDIKDAYKDKLRKCDAWEKAYSNLKEQVHGPSTAVFSVDTIIACHGFAVRQSK